MTPETRNWLISSAGAFLIGGALWWLSGGYSAELRFIGQMIFAGGAIALGFALDEYERPT